MATIRWSDLRGALDDLRRSWPQLVLADFLARTVAVVAVAPLATGLLKLFLMTTDDGVLADADIAVFVLHPIGLTALILVGGISLGVWFAEQAVLMTIGFGAVEDRRVTWLDAVRYVIRHTGQFVRLAAGLIARLLLLAAPFVAVCAGLYLFFMSQHDINFYLVDKPPEFWRAVGLAAIVLAVLAILVMRQIASWILTLPLVLFEKKSGRQAVQQSRRVTAGRNWTIVFWLLFWFLSVGLASALLTFIVREIGGLLIPDLGGSMTRIAISVAITVFLGFAVNLTLSVVTTVLLPLFVVRLYRAMAGPGRLLPEIAERGTLGDQAGASIPGKSILLGGVAALLLVSLALYIAGTRMHEPEEIAIIAHRGASGAAPENTMEAFERAVTDGADWIELDVQEDGDGIVVVAHDSDFMKVAGSPLKVWDATAADLRALDIGGWFAPEFTDQRVPTLRQALELARGELGVVIELKYYGHDRQLEREVVAIVEQTAMEDDVMLMSLKLEGLRKAAALRPEWTHGLLNTASVGDLTRLDLDFLALNAAAASRAQIRRAHQRGMKVYVWTIDDPVQMTVMLSRGADGIITDEPARARRVIEMRHRLSPFGRLVLWVAGESGLLKGADESSTADDA